MIICGVQDINGPCHKAATYRKEREQASRGSVADHEVMPSSAAVRDAFACTPHAQALGGFVQFRNRRKAKRAVPAYAGQGEPRRGVRHYPRLG
jgi:hypothetical protein